MSSIVVANHYDFLSLDSDSDSETEQTDSYSQSDSPKVIKQAMRPLVIYNTNFGDELSDEESDIISNQRRMILFPNEKKNSSNTSTRCSSGFSQIKALDQDSSPNSSSTKESSLKKFFSSFRSMFLSSTMNGAYYLLLYVVTLMI